MVEGDQAVGFSSAEAGFGLDNRITALSVDALDGVDEQRPNAGGYVCSAEKFCGVAIFS